MTAIQTENLTKKYKERIAVNALNLRYLDIRFH